MWKEMWRNKERVKWRVFSTRYFARVHDSAEGIVWKRTKSFIILFNYVYKKREKVYNTNVVKSEDLFQSSRIFAWMEWSIGCRLFYDQTLGFCSFLKMMVQNFSMKINIKILCLYRKEQEMIITSIDTNGTQCMLILRGLPRVAAVEDMRHITSYR